MPPPDVDLPGEWDDTDHAIFDARIRQGMVWRDVGPHVGMSYEGARKRFYRRMLWVETAEVDAYRNEENEKYDEREHRLVELMNSAVTAKDYKAAIQALRVLNDVSRGRAQLNNLNVQTVLDDVSVEEAEAAIGRMLDAYLQGVRDGDAARAATGSDA